MPSPYEVEQKYRAGGIDKESFLKKLSALRPKKKSYVSSPDTYYEDSKGRVLRWRCKGVDEFTIKHRTSERSTLVRKESDLLIDPSCRGREKLHFIKDLGYKKAFRLYKDCHIYWFQEVSVVFYTVRCRGFRDRDFIEIEVDKDLHLSEREATEFVRQWETKLGLKPHQRLNSTLYEIYSGKSTELLD